MSQASPDEVADVRVAAEEFVGFQNQSAPGEGEVVRAAVDQPLHPVLEGGLDAVVEERVGVFEGQEVGPQEVLGDQEEQLRRQGHELSLGRW